MVVMQGWELRSLRQAAGLTLRQVARAAGTKESNVAAYERGAKTANAGTLARLLAAIKAGAKSPVHVNNLMTVAATASAVREALRDGRPDVEVLRLVRQMISDSKWVRSEDDLATFYARPSTTGDQRWDAMLAGLAEHLNVLHGRRAPAWTTGSGLDHFWFFGTDPAFDALSFTSTPTSLRVRGVVVDGAALESV
jgi:transcriptional regulator with XRE-family HTH domain